MKKRPRTFVTATRRLAGFAVVSVLTLLALTGTVSASGDTASGDPPCQVNYHAIAQSCITTTDPGSSDPVVPAWVPPPANTDPAGGAYGGASITQAPVLPGGYVVPQSTPGANTVSDQFDTPLPPTCPAMSSRGGTLGRVKMTLHIQQAAFPNCPITGFYFDPPVTDTPLTPQFSACLTAFTQLANSGLIPLNATISLVDALGDTCVFVNGILVNIIPQQSSVPVTTATQACLTAWQAALLGGTVTGTGFWVITDLQGDTCLFNSGVLQAVRTPTDSTPAPQVAIGTCLTAWQQALLNNTAVLVGHFELTDTSGDTCVFFNSVLQYVQLPGTFNLLPTFFI